MRRIEVTYSTMGQASRAPLGNGQPYVWNGDPAKATPAPQEGPRELRGGPKRRAEGKAERFARFCVLRGEGVGWREAGKRVGIQPKTARTYERERLALAKTEAAS